MKFCVWMKVSAQKYPNKTISVLQLKVFFAGNIAFSQIEGAEIKHQKIAK